ncbi:monooxygenase, partial [Metarhizium majus ARSEF 297]
MIGNGATAAQILPEIIDIAQSVTVFQRSRNWMILRDDKPISETIRTIYRYAPGVYRRYRASLMDIHETLYESMVDVASPVNDLARQLCLDMMNKQIPDNADLKRKPTPDYAPGCKRVIISDDYFPAISRENITLQTNPIDDISPEFRHGVRAQHELEANPIILIIEAQSRY